MTGGEAVASGDRREARRARPRSRDRGEFRGADDAASGAGDDGPLEPCLRCGVPLPLRQMGCKGGHCPNCAHPYPHGDCSD